MPPFIHKNIRPSHEVIYLDHAATTPIRPEVKRAMAPFWSEEFGNPSALYKLGLNAKEAIAEARNEISTHLGARPDEIVFTAGGTESINMALVGVAHAQTSRPRPTFKGSKKNQSKGHIITSVIEHHAVLNTIHALAEEGFTVTHLSVDKNGMFNIDEFKNAIRPDTFLVSLMYANNEIGTVEPIAEIGKIIKKINVQRRTEGQNKHNTLSPIIFHSDACQAAGYLTLRVDMLGVDLLSINGSKIYGPKQSGCLYVRKGTRIKPTMHGGGQERNIRSGTENVPAIVGFAKALKLAEKEKSAAAKRVQTLTLEFISLLTSIPDSVLNGPSPSQAESAYNRLPNNINISFKGVDGEALVLYLDAYNIAAATGSACTSQSTDPSHVLEAIGLSKAYVNGSIRFTLGRETTKHHITYAAKVLKYLVQQQRKTINTLHT